MNINPNGRMLPSLLDNTVIYIFITVCAINFVAVRFVCGYDILQLPVYIIYNILST